MIVSEEIINSLLRDKDVMFRDGILSVSDADDLSISISWIIGKSLNESNVNFVIGTLRGYKSVMNPDIVSRVINSFRSLLGSYM